MRAVVQRVAKASISVNGGARQEIGQGLVVLVAVGPDDGPDDARYMAEKIAGLRIFQDDAGKMNLSVRDIDHGACLLVSQFTLFGDARRGKRPSFISAAQPDYAIPLYNQFVELMRRVDDLRVVTGEFGADMMVEIHNDGPVTILVDSAKLF
ncbi:MAG: D-aminoacyl-tRNA deacylase [Capsulimonadaceae bacterium]|nr:D-aminoacyl-tRNA deacylase [Capsulimonadaceae bacterium]